MTAGGQPDGRVSAPRAARSHEGRQIRDLLAEAIDASPYYEETFRAFEKARFSEFYIRALIEIDPWNVCVVDNGTEIVAFSITIPEFGTVWAPWLYVKPGYRKTTAGTAIIRANIRHWDENRFHKMACYVRPDNRPAATIFRRYGFKEVAVLRSHVFGQDFILFELPLRKTIAGYDRGVDLSRRRRWTIRLNMWLRR